MMNAVEQIEVQRCFLDSATGLDVIFEGGKHWNFEINGCFRGAVWSTDRFGKRNMLIEVLATNRSTAKSTAIRIAKAIGFNVRGVKGGSL